jgi:hypothetical protein
MNFRTTPGVRFPYSGYQYQAWLPSGIIVIGVCDWVLKLPYVI